MTRGRVLGLLGLAGGLAFGAMGGEYSTVDWFTLKRQVGREVRLMEHIGIEIDSLTRYIHALEDDPAMLERVAREKVGMIRDGETLYRVEEK